VERDLRARLFGIERTAPIAVHLLVRRAAGDFDCA
jgi:hypothetical protein